MKKLLSILGTITIAGSGMAGLVGNAPAPEKNNINYQQSNNLENLSRNKRGKVTLWNKNDLGIDKKRVIDKVKNIYCGLCHNYLILEINTFEVQDIIFFRDIHPNNRDALYNKVFGLINNFEKENHSADTQNSDYISNNDISILTNVIVDHFDNIKNTFNNEGLIIRTNRNSYWTDHDDDNWWGVHTHY